MRRWRRATWALIVWEPIVVVWTVIWYVTLPSCTTGSEDYQLGCRLGRAYSVDRGIPDALSLWFIGFVVISIIWFMTRPKTQPIP